LIEVISIGTPDPSHGSIVDWKPNGTFTFRPATDWTGTTVFPYTITDVGTGLSATANIYITVVIGLTASNDSYIGLYDQDYSPPADNPIVLNDVSNSSTPDLQVVWAGNPTPDTGTLVSWDGAGSFVFRPKQGWSGELRVWAKQVAGPSCHTADVAPHACLAIAGCSLYASCVAHVTAAK
jgi:hypothetical protein